MPLRIDSRKDKYGPHLMIDDGDPAKPTFRSAMPSEEIAKMLAGTYAAAVALVEANLTGRMELKHLAELREALKIA